MPPQLEIKFDIVDDSEWLIKMKFCSLKDIQNALSKGKLWGKNSISIILDLAFGKA